ncbi:hypothetical protein BJ912DRAFT_965115 [Pholiota molesta]|nr:hypothetical protein BJ912DRAFT_965115 [Pholiota molesta]
MGANLRIRQALIAFRKLAVLLLSKRPVLAKFFAALLRQFTALWAKFRFSWLNKSLLGCSSFDTHGQEIQKAGLQNGALIKPIVSEKPSLLHHGRPIPNQTTSLPYQIERIPETINLEGVARSLYPLSHGSHGNSWTSFAQNLSSSASVHDVSILVDEPTSFLLDNTTAQSSRSSIDSNSNIQDDCRTETSRTLHSPCHLRHSRIKPIKPQDIDRYDADRRKYCPSTSFDTTIDLPISPCTRPTPSQGWVEHVHPEGGRYFFLKEKRVYTDANVYDVKILDQAMDDISIITDFFSKNAIPLPEGADLVIDIQDDTQTNYYFANHETRSIFFLDTYETNDISIDSPGRLRHHIELQYWYHLMQYPNSLALSPALVGELKDIVLHFVGDSITSSTSTAPYDLEVLYKILDITTNLETRGNSNAVGSMSFVSRFMYIFASSRYWNYAGEAHARLDRAQSVYGKPTNQRNWFMKSISVLLFSAPKVHLKKLQQLWVDQIVYAPCWDQMFKQLNSEWQAQILLAAILLNANVGLLIIHGEDIHRGFTRSPAQISSYISMAANVGSIVMGLLLVKQTSNKRPIYDAEFVQTYLSKRLHPRMGLETLAILYSLPYAFLIWGILYFLAAFCFSCFQSSDTSTRIIVGTLCAPIVILSWWAYTSWGKLLQRNESREENYGSDKQSNGDVQPVSTPLGAKWVMPANRWVVHAISKLRNQSQDTEKAVVV